jgi:lipopolysaccharide export system permease protein
MNTLDRYITRTLTANFILALAALLAIFSVVNLMQELADVGTGSYDLSHALRFLLMTLPAEAYKLFPAAALLGAVLGLGTLASHNEILSILAAGVSRARLTGAVLQAAALLVVVAVVLGEFVAAPLTRVAQAERSVALSHGMSLTTANGVWTRDGMRFINVRHPLPDGTLHDLYVYEFDASRRMRSFTYASSATYDKPKWRLKGVVENVFGADSVRTEPGGTRVWDTFVSPGQLRVLFLPPEELSISDLYRSIGSLSGRGESPRRHQLAFWRRILMPAVTGIMVFLAIPFILTMLREVTLGQRIVAGALLGIGFQMFNETFGQMGLVYGLDPISSASLPALAALSFGLWRMSRVE